MDKGFNKAGEFEYLLRALIESMGYAGVKSNFSSEVGDIDLIFDWQNGMGVLEAKYYRYMSPPSTSLFVKALKQVSRIRDAFSAERSILAISCPVTLELLIAAGSFPYVDVWGAEELFIKAAPFPEILKGFESLFEVSAAANTQAAIALEIVAADERESVSRDGALIAEKLLSIKPGREQAVNFEDACITALKYLFESDLYGWYEQLNTDDDLHRRDLICRILPSSDVWRLMLTDIHSRYVIFEFKNYKDQITQKEIVTTEKYLYPTALRNVAFLISPKGCSPSAQKVMRGAMRESGKLIISLSITELVKLLIEKDDGGDPNVYLFDQVDRFLMRLGR
ncbi:hypothetical protein [Pseudomonas viridiflava]|uniref:hypothetical protein n=1 Tax=Pseudomonas viridiflava TaxID=33069 RepID=UPI002A6A86AE|nr:hypothetical protein [Pseudomonas viridiflava]MDY0918848.1 hypothetical protein [Pseudomonas viridiflava]